MPSPSRPPLGQQLARWVVGVGLVFTGIAHLTFARVALQAQVPLWVPMNADLVVVLSGIVEIVLGACLVALPGHRRRMALLVTVFLVAVFPGNISQYVNQVDALGLDTDRKRLIRLLVEPLLLAAALHAGGLLSRSSMRQLGGALKRRRRT